MKKVALTVAALLGACLFTAGIASAQELQAMHDGQYRDEKVAVPVAGFSPNFADNQPKTGPELNTTLTEDANRLIRWQGWLDVDAFSASVLEQMQKQLGNGIEIGKFTLAEPSIVEAVNAAAAKDRRFVMNENLKGEGENLTDVKLYVWTYRHNYTDTGLYQLYVSVKGNMLIGKGTSDVPVPHKDIQSPSYEFGSNGITPVPSDVFAVVEIWRAAVVRVNARGAIKAVGIEADVDDGIEKTPIVAWEMAPSLIDNPHYDPTKATGAGFVEPLDRVKVITENKVQKTPGSVQKEGRVRTMNPYRYRYITY